jgi:Chitobiase/beta-hexosaminidase C-terminal domain
MSARMAPKAAPGGSAGTRHAAVALGAAGLAAAALIAAAPAPAGPPAADGVRDGRNVAVFHNLDFVAAFGYDVDDRLTVDVYRGPHRIGTVTAPALSTPDGTGLEINHGFDGTPQPGDCWPVYTPDIQPGDRIVVSDATGQDATHVDAIRITSPPAIDPATQDVVMEGTARGADGTPIPATLQALDSGEVRNTSKFRAAPTRIERIAGTEDGWRATFERALGYGVDPAKSLGLDASPAGLDARRDSIVAGEAAIGYGHGDPLPPVTQLVEGADDVNAPAPGCPVGGRLDDANAVIVTDDEAVNAASGDLQISGTAEPGVAHVRVTVNDGDAATPALVAETSDLFAGSGDKSWSVTLRRAQLDALEDGSLTLSGDFDGAPGGGRTIAKDVLAPAAPAATPPPGTYAERQSVTLHGEQGADIRHTRDGSEPTIASPRARGPLVVRGSQTVKAIVVDAAGNRSPVASLPYTIAARRAAPRAARSGARRHAPAGGHGDRAPARVPARADRAPSRLVADARPGGSRAPPRAPREPGPPPRADRGPLRGRGHARPRPRRARRRRAAQLPRHRLRRFDAARRMTGENVVIPARTACTNDGSTVRCGRSVIAACIACARDGRFAARAPPVIAACARRRAPELAEPLPSVMPFADDPARAGCVNPHPRSRTSPMCAARG